MRNGWIYVNLRNNLSERIGARAGWVGAPAVLYAFLGAAWRVREEWSQNKKRRAEWRDGLSIK